MVELQCDQYRQDHAENILENGMVKGGETVEEQAQSRRQDQIRDRDDNHTADKEGQGERHCRLEACVKTKARPGFCRLPKQAHMTPFLLGSFRLYVNYHGDSSTSTAIFPNLRVDCSNVIRRHSSGWWRPSLLEPDAAHPAAIFALHRHHSFALVEGNVKIGASCESRGMKSAATARG